MKHTEIYQVRWHDTDVKHEVRPSTVLVYLQETANRQFYAHGLSLDDLYEQHRIGFLLSRIAVRFYNPLHAYETVTAETWTAGSKGFAFDRGFRLTRDGQTVAEAVSLWALVHADTHRMLRAADTPIRFEDEPLPEVDVPLRFLLPPDALWEDVGTRKIVYSDLDFNGHMNNTHYPDMLCDFLPDPAKTRVTALSLSFLREAPAGECLRITRAQDPAAPHVLYFRTYNTAQDVCLEARMETARV